MLGVALLAVVALEVIHTQPGLSRARKSAQLSHTKLTRHQEAALRRRFASQPRRPCKVTIAKGSFLRLGPLQLLLASVDGKGVRQAKEVSLREFGFRLQFKLHFQLFAVGLCPVGHKASGGHPT